MKRLLALLLLPIFAFADTCTTNGVTWTFTVVNGEAVLGKSWFVRWYNDWIWHNITAVPADTHGKVQIPSSLNGFLVTSIGPSAFAECTELTGVTIPSSVTNVCSDAFSGCSSITSFDVDEMNQNYGAGNGLLLTKDGRELCCGVNGDVSIPMSVTSIGGSAFSGCSGLTSVTIPSSVTSIGDSAFSGCSGLTSVTIPSSVTSIGGCAFYGCSGLTNVTLPLSLTSIGNYAFYGCSGLTNVTIPSSVTSIGYEAFYNCSGLTSVMILSCVTSIGHEAFYGCCSVSDVTAPGWKCEIDFSLVTNLVISEGTTNIGDSAFSGCSGLTSISIPSSVTSIGGSAFSGCSVLTSVTIPSSVTSIGDSAFEGCSGLKSILIPSSVMSISDSTFSGCSGLTSVTIPSRVTSIGDSTFSGCSGLTSVTIPSRVTSIGDSAFSGCSGLTSVTIPSSVTSIGDSAFSGCSGLKSILIPSSVMSIGGSAFSGCSGLASVSIPSSLIDINVSESPKGFKFARFSGFAYDGTSSIWNYEPTEIVLEAGKLYDSAPAYTTIAYGSYMRMRGGVRYYFRAVYDDYASVKVDGQSVIPRTSMCREGTGNVMFDEDGWHEIDLRVSNQSGSCGCVSGYSYYGIQYKTSEDENWRNFVEDGRGTFCCSAEKFASQISGVTNMFTSASQKIREVVVTGELEKIPDDFFSGCTALESVTLPDGCETTPEMFAETKVMPQYDENGLWIVSGWVLGYGGAKDVTKLTIPAGVVGIAHDVFVGLADLESVSLPSTLKYIRAGAFDECTALEKIELPNSVTEIDECAFRNCTALTAVTFGKGVKSIGDDVFSGCSSLLNVELNDGLESIGERVFQNCWRMMSVAIPYSVCTIGDDAFAGCTHLTGATVPSSVMTLKQLFPDAEIATVSISDGETVVMDEMFSGCDSLTAVEVPQGVTNIGCRAFAGCSSLIELSLPGSLVTIGEGAFQNCSTFSSLAVPNAVESVGGGAFSYCSGLKNVSLSRALKILGDSAFSECYNLEQISFPDAVEQLGENVFGSCWNLKTVRFAGNAPLSVDGNFYADSPCDLVTYVVSGSTGWDGVGTSRTLPDGWPNSDERRAITFWDPVQFAVTFDGNGGSPAKVSMTETTGLGYVLPDDPTRSGFVFSGWWTSAKDGAEIKSSTLVTQTKTHTLYAHWKAITAKINVRMVDGEEGGTVSGGNQTINAGTKLTLKATAKKGYVFSGWYEDPDGGRGATALPISQLASYSYTVGEDDATLYAKFIPTSEDYANVSVDAKEEYARGVAIEPIAIVVDSGSLAAVKVTGLPSGLKFTSKLVTSKVTTGSGKDKVTTLVTNALPNTIYGTPTKSGVSTVTVTATTAGKATATETFKMIVRADGEAVVDAEVVLTDAIGTIASTGAVPGKVTGMGVYTKGKTLTLKAVANKGYVFAGWYGEDAIETIASTGEIVSTRVIASDSVSRQTSYVLTAPGSDVTYYARFVAASDDGEISVKVEDEYTLNGYWELELDIDSLSLPSVTVKGLPTGLKFDAKTLTISGTPTKPGVYTVTLSLKNATIKKAKTQTFVINVANIESPYLTGVSYAKDAYNYRGGVAVGWTIASCATDGYKISSVSGLPTGLKFNAKTGKIEGVPTKAGKYTATITLKNGKATSLATVTLNVTAIDSWAYGTFNGGSDDGQVQLSITSAGKLSGKYLADGITYALAAPSFSDYEGDAYQADVTASWSYKENKKTVKKSETWPITVEAGEVGGVLTADEFTAGQNVWSQTSWKAFGSSYFGKRGTVKTLTGDEYGLGEGESITMTIKPNGTVTLKGTFDTGTVKNDRPVSYTATGSAVVCVTSYDPFVGQVFVYFAPNANKNFSGYVRSVQIDEYFYP